jgi:hypothetical protein
VRRSAHIRHFGIMVDHQIQAAASGMIIHPPTTSAAPIDPSGRTCGKNVNARVGMPAQPPNTMKSTGKLTQSVPIRVARPFEIAFSVPPAAPTEGAYLFWLFPRADDGNCVKVHFRLKEDKEWKSGRPFRSPDPRRASLKMALHDARKTEGTQAMTVTEQPWSIRVATIALAGVLLSPSGALAQSAVRAVTVPSTRAGEVTVTLHGTEPDSLIPIGTAFTGNASTDRNDEYASIVAKAMPEAFDPSVLVRELVLAPFSGEEYSLALRPMGDGWRLFALRSTSWLWEYTSIGIAQEWELHHKRLPADGYRRIKMERCSVRLDRALGSRIVVLWQEMLRGATPHPFKEPSPADSSEILLFAKVDGKTLAATPAARPREHVLAFLDLVEAMEEACAKPGGPTHSALAAEIDRFANAPSIEH